MTIAHCSKGNVEFEALVNDDGSFYDVNENYALVDSRILSVDDAVNAGFVVMS